MSVFNTIFPTIGTTMTNHDVYKKAKVEYIKRGYTAKAAQYAALGMMSGRSQGPTCKYYSVLNKTIMFERIA